MSWSWPIQNIKSCISNAFFHHRPTVDSIILRSPPMPSIDSVIDVRLQHMFLWIQVLACYFLCQNWRNRGFRILVRVLHPMYAWTLRGSDWPLLSMAWSVQLFGVNKIVSVWKLQLRHNRYSRWKRRITVNGPARVKFYLSWICFWRFDYNCPFLQVADYDVHFSLTKFSEKRQRLTIETTITHHIPVHTNTH